nr:CpaD family pilus assembly protein [uncultured Sphingomonas sp.]
MRYTLALLTLASALAGCTTPSQQAPGNPLRGLDPVNVPVVTRADYTLDVSAPDGSLASGETARLDGWFRGMELGYGDNVYVDGTYSDAARRDVAQVAGRYGILVSSGAPVAGSAIAPGMVRVVVSRTRASVPNCPNWSAPPQPNLGNHSMTNLGCAVNGNMAAMIGNPEDLVHGREGSGVSDAARSSKAIDSYRNAPLSGAGSLPATSSKGN